MVPVIKSLEEFRTLIESGKTIVIDFSATWCGPCKVISPIFEKMAADGAFPSIEFYNVDVDEQEAVAAEVGIKAMPTFLFFRNGTEVGKVIGADPNKLKAAMALQHEEAVLAAEEAK